MPSSDSQKKRNSNLLGTAALGAGVGGFYLDSVARNKTKIVERDPKNIAVMLAPSDSGSGHASAAGAIKSDLESRGYRVKLFNPKDYKNRLGKFLSSGDLVGYRERVQRDPAGVFGHTFFTTEPGNSISGRFKNWFIDTTQDISQYIGGEGRMAKDIKSFKPGRIISTYHGNLGTLKDSGMAVDLVGTDYLMSPELWKKDNVGNVFVPTEQNLKYFKNHGVSAKKLHVTGEVPVRKELLETAPKTNSTGKKIITVMGGGLGLRTEEVGPAVAKYYESKGIPFQLNIITGKDTVATKFFKNKAISPNISVIPGTSNIKKFIEESDIIVTRPGGSTTAELRLSGKPVVTYMEHSPEKLYHEAGNVKALSSQGTFARIPKQKYVDQAITDQSVARALSDLESEMPKYQKGALATRDAALKNQKKIVDTILSTKVLENKSISRLSKLRAAGAATAVGAGTYSIIKGNKE
jgi:processive 1,2-diacylglycerol beta-glucosyltransferase